MSAGRVRKLTARLLFSAAIVSLLATLFWSRDLSPLRNDAAVPTAVSTQTGVVGLIVEPDDGRLPVLAEIEAARSSIDVMIYLLTDRQIVDALIAAEGRGVVVRVILEQYPYGGFGNPEQVAAELRTAGVEVKWAAQRFTFSHVKALVVDGSVALIMNLNLTRSAFETNREFAVITTRAAEVASIQALFEADWRGQDEPRPGSLVVSPSNSRHVLTALIESARVSLELYAQVVRDEAVADALAAAAERGVRVRLVTSPDIDPVATRMLTELAERGVEVRLVSTPYIHAKAIVVDAKRAFVGSQNLTATSLDENREIGLIFADPAAVARLLRAFEADFASGERAA